MRILIAEPDHALAKRLQKVLCDLHPEQEGDPILLSEPVRFQANLADDATLLLVSPSSSVVPSTYMDDLRQTAASCRVIVLAADSSAQVRADFLLAGADDCLSKPLSMVELRARCLAVLRRPQPRMPREDGFHLRFGVLGVDRLQRTAMAAGSPLPLTGREFRILEQLALAGGALVSRAALVRSVWGGNDGETNALDVHLAALRRKLRHVSDCLNVGTVRGAGFRLEETAAPSATDALLDGSFRGFPAHAVSCHTSFFPVLS